MSSRHLTPGEVHALLIEEAMTLAYCGNVLTHESELKVLLFLADTETFSYEERLAGLVKVLES